MSCSGNGEVAKIRSRCEKNRAGIAYSSQKPLLALPRSDYSLYIIPSTLKMRTLLKVPVGITSSWKYQTPNIIDRWQFIDLSWRSPRVAAQGLVAVPVNAGPPSRPQDSAPASLGSALICVVQHGHGSPSNYIHIQ